MNGRDKSTYELLMPDDAQSPESSIQGYGGGLYIVRHAWGGGRDAIYFADVICGDSPLDACRLLANGFMNVLDDDEESTTLDGEIRFQLSVRRIDFVPNVDELEWEEEESWEGWLSNCDNKNELLAFIKDKGRIAKVQAALDKRAASSTVTKDSAQ